MKKILFFAIVMMATIGVSAQHVKKVDLKLVEYEMDSLRKDHANNPTALLGELELIQHQQKTDAQTLKQLDKELKQEIVYAKSLTKYVKSADSGLKTILKSYEQELKSLKKMRNIASDEQAQMRKLDLVACPQRDQFIQQLHDEVSDLGSQIATVQNRINAVQKEMANITRLQNDLNVLEAEIKAKTQQIKSLNAMQKEREKQIQAEIKIAKVSIK